MKQIKSSNKDMTDPLQLLENIKKVSAPENLYENVLVKIQQKNEENFVHPIFYKAIAAVFALIFGSQILFFVQKNKLMEEKNLAQIVSFNKNQLYNEQN